MTGRSLGAVLNVSLVMVAILAPLAWTFVADLNHTPGSQPSDPNIFGTQSVSLPAFVTESEAPNSVSLDLIASAREAQTLSSGYFTKNSGQVANPNVVFYGSVGNLRIGFGDSAIYLLTWQGVEPNDALTRSFLSTPGASRPFGPSAFDFVQVTFAGSRRVQPAGLEPVPFRSNFLLGPDPASWFVGVRSYKAVVYENLYDGIDLVYHLDPSGVKYEFLVHPGANPDEIEMAYSGAEGLRIEDAGGLVIVGRVAESRDSSPIAYEAGEVGSVSCAFHLRSVSSVGFQCQGWRGDRTLTIDPLVYSTFLGGGGDDASMAIAVGATGNAYVTGTTWSVDFPTTPGAYDSSYGGTSDAFVTELNADGTALVYSTFLGGTDYDESDAIALDSTGNVILAGYTSSPDFPTTPGAFDRVLDGGLDVFVAKLDASGSSLVFSTFLGGNDGEWVYALATDGAGNPYIVGYTYSTDFPTTLGAFDRSLGSPSVEDAFVAKLTAAGDGLLYGTYLGGMNPDQAMGVGVDSAGEACVAGSSSSSDFPTSPGAYDTTYNGGDDAFVTKLNADGAALVYSTFLGGSGDDRAVRVASTLGGDCYVAGYTNSADFPTTPGAYDMSWNGGWDAFVAHLDPSGGIVYSGFLGASGDDFAAAVAVDSAGDAHLLGATTSTSFPVTQGAYDSSANGNWDLFVAKLNASGSRLVYGTYLGSPGYEYPTGLALGSGRSVYVTAYALHPGFPTTSGAFQPAKNGGYDSVVVKLDENGIPRADAGPDQANRLRYATVTVNGTASSDPDGDPLSYNWIQTQGPAVNLTGASTITATFTPALPGLYGFQLSVSDGFGGTASDAVNVAVIDQAPVAEAGPDQYNMSRNTLIVLNGSASFDPEGDSLAYMWMQTAGPAVNLSGFDQAIATFTAFYPDNYGFRLTVTDSYGEADEDNVTITAVNRLPVANAGPDQSNVFRNALVTLNGNASSDPDGDSLAFLWTQVSGPSVALVGADQAIATFVPTASGAYTFNLTVDDGFGGRASDTISVLAANRAPVAEAGPDQTVLKRTLAALNGTGSPDPDGDPLSYLWTQVSGPLVVLSGADTPRPTLTPPISGAYVFQLSVSDGEATSTDVVQVTALNQAPTARAGPDQAANKRTIVTLDGTTSADLDGDLLLLSWVQTGGPPVTLTGSQTALATFTPAVSGVYIFQLTVDDGDGGTATDIVQVTVINRSPIADAGLNQSVWKRAAVNLDGTGSSDPDGDSLTFYWELIGGPVVAVSNATSATAWIFPMVQGTYLFRLTVDDGDNLGTSSATVAVTTWSRPPIANLTASPNSARAGATVHFDGSASFDPDGAIVTFSFQFGDGSSSTGPSPTDDHAYLAGGTYTAVLTVVDDDGNASAAQVTVIITQNIPPNAVATASPPTGTMATAFHFDGANSTDADGAIASWSWSFGDGGTATGVQATHTYARKGAFIVTLTVTDNEGGTGQASILITVANRGPEIVSTGPARSVAVGSGAPQTFTVTATDPDGDPLAYTWRVDGLAAGGNASSYDFRQDAAGTYRVNVTVSDGIASVSYEWTVTITQTGTPAGAGPALWVALVIIGMVAVVLAISWRRRRNKESKARESSGDER